MPLEPGHTLLHYRLVEKIGQGGMGIVWKAVDTTLDRPVAIKIILDEFAADTARLARFEREAKLLASLNHPGIATVHSIEEVDGMRFLAMEFVDGEDLAQRLARGAIPIEEAARLAAQIAGALGAAHDNGVIHRDLKPANIRVTPEGRVKVLDFGLAKALAPATDTASPDANLSLSPTLTATGTAAGLILGTAAYMSPEQARGGTVDRRTDIWSFGVVLFESLTGRAPFAGQTAVDAIGAILHREPDWSRLPAGTPLALRRLLRRCLQKDRDRRLRDAGDARIEIEEAMADPPGSEISHAAPAPRSSRILSLVALLLALAAGIVIGWLLGRTPIEPHASPMIGFSIDLSAQDLMPDKENSNLALDPSGATLAFVALSGQKRQIFARPLASGEVARAVQGTEGGARPFFSPDGRWLGFVRDGKLLKVPSGGGPALTICEACEVDGLFADPVWLDDGTIVYIGGVSNSGLERIDAAGARGTLAQTGPHGPTAGSQRAITGFDSPVRVPGQPYVLASVYYDVTIEDYDIVTISLEDGSVRWVLPNATEPRYMPPGRLLFSRESSLFAAPFDPRRGVVTGEPELIVDGIHVGHWADNAQYAVAANGTLAYVPGQRLGTGRMVVRVDRDGRTEASLPEPDALLGGLRVSPDGTRVLLTTIRHRAELWSFDLRRPSFDLISNVAPVYSPLWMPDGKEVVYLREGYGKAPSAILRQAIGGADDGRSIGLLNSMGGSDAPTSISPDGRFLLIQQLDSTGRNRSDLLLFELGKEGYAKPLVATPADEAGGVFSPDGDWYAYQSDESGRDEVYVRRFPDSGRRRQVSVDGGQEPRWSPDGRKLYFSSRGALFECLIQTADGFAAQVPVKLFDRKGISAQRTPYEVLPDGSFLMIQAAPWESESTRIKVVVHWDGRPLH